jgi:hypothetical protein
MNAVTTSRRALIGAAILAPIVVAQCAQRAPAAAQGSTPLAAAIAAWRRADAAEDAYYVDVYTKSHDRWENACAAIPHYVEKRAESWGAITPQLSTASADDMEVVRWELRNRDRPDVPNLAGYIRACRRLVAADEARKAEIARLKQAYRVDEFSMRVDDLCCAAYAALRVVEGIHPSNAAEFAEKLAILHERERFDDEDVQAMIVADAHHLARLGSN